MLAKAYIEISDLVMGSAKSLEARLADLLIQRSENKTLNSENVEAYPVHNMNGFSGYNYWIDGNLTGQLHLASLTSGYYVFLKKIYLEEQVNEIYDYYNQDGDYVYSAESLDGQALYYNSINMDPTDAFVNHLYNVLHVQYEQAENGMGETKRIGVVEGVLNSLLRNPRTAIGANEKRRDPALLNIIREIHRVEKDPVLNWEERQRVYSSLKQVRKKILRTKRRAHKFNSLSYQAPIKLYDAKVKLDVMKRRPADNFVGIFKKYTWGRLMWFFRTVHANLGLSIAMAIYGPFTFYFITQPMNPHAMWAVGKVRNAYIDFAQTFAPAEERQEKTLVAQDELEAKDEVSTRQAAAKKHSGLPEQSESWDDRMSSFKAMQIAYEESMVFAARMGRIEQMENQFLFPLTAESSWEEMERYLAGVHAALKYNPNLDARYKAFLKREIARTRDLQVYIWRKMAQFFNDHPYIMVDQENEQTAKDYYVGRAFIFMKKMTDTLSKTDLASAPATHKKVMELAKKFEKLKQDGETIMESLRKNSKLFAQKDFFDTDELRKEFRRHWEILFLQQNKKQEASSFGLQAYTWSVRNAIWILQSIYSAKREELSSLTFKYNLDNQNVDSVASDHDISALYESMMNMLALEFVSIKKEIANNLKNDTEAAQRKDVIENIRDFLNERDKLFNGSMKMATGSDSSVKI